MFPFTKQTPIADLHCDLLCHLASNVNHSAYDLNVRCAIPQLKAGLVKLQTMAIYTETKLNSSQNGLMQAECYKWLIKKHPETFEFLKSEEQLSTIQDNEKILILPAIENASSICDEEEDLNEALKRADILQRKIGKFLYVGFTWNTENRFGGGASTHTGLKEDGMRLLDYLAEHKMAIDFSHTSDQLADDIINYVDKKNFKIPFLASHSNMRAIKNHPRNLKCEIAKEIYKRQGLVGLNFVKYFIGETSPLFFAKQLEHMFKLGGENSTCFGADFFNEMDLPVAFRHADGSFFKEFSDASCYPALLDLVKSHLPISEKSIENISWKNLTTFIKNHYF